MGKPGTLQTGGINNHEIFRSSDRKTRRDRMRNNFLFSEAGNQNLLIELDEE
jgi:hypothetical protein